MLRVVLGRARPDTEWSGKISGLQFNSAPGVQGSATGSTILTIPRCQHGEEVDLEAYAEFRTEPDLDQEEHMSGINESV
jgi:hypothetical protein